jgi:pyruvate dehydrogenase (quinone)/pyruvate oxidase
METCDTLFMVGTSFPYIEFLPKPGKARAVQIELDPMRIGLRYPVEIGLVADSRNALEALVPHLKRNENRRFLQDAQKGMTDWRELMEERASRMDKPMKPQVIASELGRQLLDNAIVSADSGTVATWWLAISLSSGARCIHFLETWPAWPTGSAMRSRHRSLIRTAVHRFCR